MSKDFDSYDDCVRSDNRLVLLFSAIILVFFLGMAFVSAIETKGGVINGTFEYGIGTTTASQTIPTYLGDKNYYWQCLRTNSSSGTCTFDTTEKYSGNQSIRITAKSTATGNRGVRIVTAYDAPGGTFWDNTFKINVISVKPSTQYKISGCIKLGFVGDDSNTTIGFGQIYVQYFDSTGTHITSSDTTKYLNFESNDWECKSSFFTTPTNIDSIAIGSVLFNTENVDKNAWFDDVRLEEVDTVSLSTQSSGRPSLTITGVTDTNAIDQSQKTILGTARAFGYPGGLGWAQQFTPTNHKLTGITFRKSSLYGTGITDSVTISIRKNLAEAPSTTILASKTYTAEQFNALSNGADIFTELPAITPDANYWIAFVTDANDSVNYARIYFDSGAGYTSGAMNQSVDGTTWTSATGDLYFKTHFAKLSSSVDLNVVASDGTSELKSYDVNGDILTDANITINPDGTGRYYYKPNSVNVKWLNDVYEATDGGYTASTYEKVLNRWIWDTSDGGTFASVVDSNLTYKFQMPENCTINGLNVTDKYYNDTTRYVNIYVSNDNVNWSLLHADINTISTVSTQTSVLDGNKVFYYKAIGKSTGVNKISFYYNSFIVDANLSCPSLTTPLFKNGTNTIYTMNKDANQQAGATLTPSLMSNITFIEQANINTYDENTTLPLTDITITFNSTTYNTGTDSNIKIPLTGLTPGNEYTLTFSKTGYNTRTYTFTASTTNFIDINLALLPTELSQEINFKFFKPDEITAYANIYIEPKKGTLTLGRQKTNTLGEITLYLDQNATGLTFDMNNGENTYQAVLLTINRPKSETTLLDIPENWGYEISGLATYLDSNISGNTQTFAIYSNTLQSYTIQITSQSIDPDYTPRKYDVQIIGDQNTYTLQPYLIDTEVSVTTTLYTINAYTNQAIGDVTIKIYRNLPVTGKTLIEQTITDSKGQSIVYLILNQTYSFEISVGETIIRTETYTITATSAGIWFKIDPGYVFETKPALNNVLAYWTPGKNWLGESDANISTKIEYQTAVLNTRTVSSVRITCDNDGNELFQDNFSNPTVPFTQTYDFNLITKIINSVAFDGNYPITCLTRVTISDGNIIEATQTYVVRNDSPQQNLGFNLRPVFGCTATNDPNVPCPSMIFFALLATMMLTAGIMIESGFTQPEFAGILFFVGLGFFTFFTWIPPFLYVVALVIALLVYVALGVRRI